MSASVISYLYIRHESTIHRSSLPYSHAYTTPDVCLSKKSICTQGVNPLLYIIHRQLRREILAIYLRYWLSQLELKYAREDYYYCHGQSNYTQEKFFEQFLLTTLVYPKIQAKNWTTSWASKILWHKVPFAEPRPIYWPLFLVWQRDTWEASTE